MCQHGNHSFHHVCDFSLALNCIKDKLTKVIISEEKTKQNLEDQINVLNIKINELKNLQTNSENNEYKLFKNVKESIVWSECQPTINGVYGFKQPELTQIDPTYLNQPDKANLNVEKKLLFSQRPCNPQFFKTFWDNLLLRNLILNNSLLNFFPSDLIRIIYEYDEIVEYSIYLLKYNYNHENRVFFMTCNMISGFIQRSEAVSPHSLGVMVIGGHDEDQLPLDIYGIWIFRGLDIHPKMYENPNVEYYTFIRLDPTKILDRQKVESFFMGDTIPTEKGDLKVLERKFFK